MQQFGEGGLLTAKNNKTKDTSPIKHGKSLLDLESLQVVVVYCRGPKRGNSSIIKGNALADGAAKKAEDFGNG